MDAFRYFCFVFVFVIRSCLFLAAWKRAGLLARLMFSCVLSFSRQVWYLIDSIPDLCHLPKF